ncbi:MAG: chemotaxis protein CheA [Pseudomonadota bacterium]
MDINQLKALFIEEATEVIEKMDVDIINLEENPENTELLDELFRGVHTLKGSANAFNFTKLGKFVHYFEDALSYCRETYRDKNKTVTSAEIDVFLEAVDIIKAVLQIELEGSEQLPQNYASCLEHIKMLAQHDHLDEKGKLEIEKQTNTTTDNSGSIRSSVKPDFLKSDLGSEFNNDDCVYIQNFDINRIKSQLLEQESLFCIKLMLHSDIYIRGFDHSIFFKLLSSKGKVIESYWDMTMIPQLEELDVHTSSIGTITLYYISKFSINEIEDFFEYLEESEYHVSILVTALSMQESLKQQNLPVEEVVKKTLSQQSTVAASSKKKYLNHSYIKVDTLKLDELFDSIGELVIAQNFISEAEEIKNIKNESVERSLAVLSKITRRIQNGVMSLRMVPIHDTFEKMKRVARDASRKVSKDIKLKIEGARTEIDKTMIDLLSDPLIHIIRNAIDHGIENDLQNRLKQGKNSQGLVTLNAYHQAGHIAIEISDDGSGINKAKVLNKAIEKGLISEDEELSDSQIYALIMQAGFSTVDKISDISGRGVGLDVVSNAIEKLSGKIEIHSKTGLGTTFTILLPLTLAIIDGMSVKSEDDIFIIPTLSILESFIPQKQMVHTFKKEGEFVDLRGEMLPVIRLNHLLELADTKPYIWESTLICIESEKGKFALLVDDIIGRQQVVIKSLDPVLARVKELAGSVIMGNGEVALILNTEALFLPNESV